MKYKVAFGTGDQREILKEFDSCPDLNVGDYVDHGRGHGIVPTQIKFKLVVLEEETTYYYVMFDNMPTS